MLILRVILSIQKAHLKRDFSSFFVLFRWNKSKTAKKNCSTLMLELKCASFEINHTEQTPYTTQTLGHYGLSLKFLSNILSFTAWKRNLPFNGLL